MKLTINREELLSAAKQAALIAPSDSPVKELACVLMEADPVLGSLTITATNLEVTLKRQLPLHEQKDVEGSFAIDAKLFAAMLEKLCGETVTMTMDGNNQLVLECGSAQYCVSALSGRNYPRMEIPFPEDTVKVSGVPAMVQRTTFAVSDNNSMPLLKCVHLRFTKDGLRAIGSDGTCVISALGDKQSTGDISFLVPAVSLEKLAKLCGNGDVFSVGTTGKAIVFLKENFAFSARLMDGRYVDTDQMISYLKPSFTSLFDTAELRRAVLSVSTMASDNRILLHFNGDQLHLTCKGEGGNASTSLEMISLTGSPSGAYCYSAHQLERSLRVLNGSLTLGVAQQGMLILSTEEAFYMQSAMRMKESENKHAGKKAA